MENQSQSANTPRSHVAVHLSQMNAVASKCGVRIANEAELSAAVAVTEALIGARLAPLPVISRLQAFTRVSTWVTGDPVNGFFLFVPLSEAGVRAVRDGSFVPSEISDGQTIADGTACAGIYCGVYAGATHDARKAVMTFSAKLRIALFGGVPCFARAATEDGARSMMSLGFKPAIGGMQDLYVWEAEPPAQADAA
jgi:hypothetical protein